MIGYLKGNIIDQDLKSVILDVSGVGYKIHTSSGFLDKKEKAVQFWIYTAVRENSLDLYGFQSKEELNFFELLLTISGIGPKSAMAILGTAGLSNLRNAVISGNTEHLIKVSGIGRKNAEKIVLELKDKIEKLGSDKGQNSHDIDAMEALKALGFAEKDIREALKKVSEEKDMSQKLKKALKLLS